ncbi:hypothetical protein ACFL96_07585 [Thermoproteota archaeon]
MVKILVDLAEDEDKTVEVYKIVNGLKSKQEAIKKMIQHFEAEVKPKKLKKEEYFKW